MGEVVNIRRRNLDCRTCGSRLQALNYTDEKGPKAVKLCPVCDLRPCPQKRFVLKERT